MILWLKYFPVQRGVLTDYAGYYVVFDSHQDMKDKINGQVLADANNNMLAKMYKLLKLRKNLPVRVQIIPDINVDPATVARIYSRKKVLYLSRALGDHEMESIFYDYGNELYLYICSAGWEEMVGRHFDPVLMASDAFRETYFFIFNQRKG